MDDGIAVEVVEIGEDALFELVLGRDADMAEQRPGHLGEEAFDKG